MTVDIYEHSHITVIMAESKRNYNYYKAFLVNTFEMEKVRKCKSSPNLEYTCKTEVSTTMCDSIYSSTRIENKQKNDNE